MQNRWIIKCLWLNIEETLHWSKCKSQWERNRHLHSVNRLIRMMLCLQIHVKPHPPHTVSHRGDQSFRMMKELWRLICFCESSYERTDVRMMWTVPSVSHLGVRVLLSFGVRHAGEARQSHVGHQAVVEDQEGQPLSVRWPPVGHMGQKDFLWSEGDKEKASLRTKQNELHD